MNTTDHFYLAHNEWKDVNVGFLNLKLRLEHESKNLFLEKTKQLAKNEAAVTVDFPRGDYSRQHCNIWLEDRNTMKIRVRRVNSSVSNILTLVSLKLDLLLSQGPRVIANLNAKTGYVFNLIND